MIRYLSGLYWHNKQPERTTSNALLIPVLSGFPSHVMQDGLFTHFFRPAQPQYPKFTYIWLANAINLSPQMHYFHSSLQGPI